VDRRRFLLTSLAGVFAAPLAAGAQQGERVYRIGLLSEGAHPLSKPLADALSELGWIEGKNLKFERRSADSGDHLPSLAAELVRLKVDLILANGTRAARAAKEATKAIPIVFNLGEDPVVNGLVASLARPGGNLTGFVTGIYDEKALEVLKEALPAASRLVALWHPRAYGEATMSDMMKEAEIAAARLALQLRLIAVQSAEDFMRAFAEIAAQPADALIVYPSPMLFTERKPIVEMIHKHRLPSMAMALEFVELGGLMSYGASIGELHRQSAVYIDRILRGARPADLPVEQASKLELAVNLAAARELGITLPPTILSRADVVID